MSKLSNSRVGKLSISKNCSMIGAKTERREETSCENTQRGPDCNLSYVIGGPVVGSWWFNWWPLRFKKLHQFKLTI